MEKTEKMKQEKYLSVDSALNNLQKSDKNVLHMIILLKGRLFQVNCRL